MNSKLYTALMSSLAVLFLFGGMAFAKTKKIDVIYTSKVGNSLQLQPGMYRVDVAKNAGRTEVAFYNQKGNLVGQAPAKVISHTQKNARTKVDYTKVASNREVLTQISPSGWNETLIFAHPNGTPIQQ